MIILKRGEDKSIPFTARNDNGGIIDITSASIYATVKENKDSTNVLVDKANTAGGGSDSEIEVVNATLGIFLLKFDRTDFLTLTKRDYFLDVNVSNGTEYITHNETIKLEKTVKGSGGTVIPVALDQGKEVWFKNVDGTLTTIVASGWTTNPTAVWAGTTITITSADSEFTEAMLRKATDEGEYTNDSHDTSTVVQTHNSTTGTFYIYVKEVTT